MCYGRVSTAQSITGNILTYFSALYLLSPSESLLERTDNMAEAAGVALAVPGIIDIIVRGGAAVYSHPISGDWLTA